MDELRKIGGLGKNGLIGAIIRESDLVTFFAYEISHIDAHTDTFYKQTSAPCL
jgi:hypothetical protein